MQGNERKMSLVRNVPMPTRVSDDQKLDRNVSMST